MTKRTAAAPPFVDLIGRDDHDDDDACWTPEESVGAAAAASAAHRGQYLVRGLSAGASLRDRVDALERRCLSPEQYRERRERERLLTIGGGLGVYNDPSIRYAPTRFGSSTGTTTTIASTTTTTTTTTTATTTTTTTTGTSTASQQRHRPPPPLLTSEQRRRIEHNRRTALLLQCDRFGEQWRAAKLPPLNEWSDAAVTCMLEHILARARRERREFDALCAVALTCRRWAHTYALSPSAPVALVKRYVDAFMRERLAQRKFQIDNTPTKASLEPYYVFARESNPAAATAAAASAAAAGAAAAAAATDPHVPHSSYQYPTCTLVAPSVRVCWKGVRGVPSAVASRAADAPWHERRDNAVGWERGKTKTWEVRNPLVRLVAMHAQAHAECEHAPAVRAWLARVKKQWPLAKQRGAWKALAEWHDTAPALSLPCRRTTSSLSAAAKTTTTTASTTTECVDSTSDHVAT